jgi:ribosomal protein S18 acetylase RimI-like enzyme
MWVYMETWIVKDGDPELARGAHLRGVGVRADCRRLGLGRTVADGISELVDPGGQQDPAAAAMT